MCEPHTVRSRAVLICLITVKSWTWNNVQCIKNYTHITLTLDHKLFAQAIYRTYEAFTSRCTQKAMQYHLAEYSSSYPLCCLSLMLATSIWPCLKFPDHAHPTMSCIHPVLVIRGCWTPIYRQGTHYPVSKAHFSAPVGWKLVTCVIRALQEKLRERERDHVVVCSLCACCCSFAVDPVAWWEQWFRNLQIGFLCKAILL